MYAKRSFAIIAILASTLVAPFPAVALSLSYSTIWDGSTNLTVGSGTITTDFYPVHDGFSHTFAAPTLCCVVNGAAPSRYGFLDDYVFDVPAAGTVSSVIWASDSRTHDIDDLRFRLYGIDAGGTTNLLPTIGTPNGTVLNGITHGSEDGSVLAIYDGALSPGRYSLQVSGRVTSQSGGSYTGSIQFSPTPTPLPGALPLLLSGTGLLMVLRRRGQVR